MISGTLNIYVFEENTLNHKPAFEINMSDQGIQVLASHDFLTPVELKQALKELNTIFPEN